MELKKTAFFDLHEELGASMIEYAGWALPSQYTSLVEEHEAVRNHVGVFDVSHMGEIFFEGKDAIKYANYLLTNDITKLTDGKLQYNLMLNEKGGVVDDLIVGKMNDEKLLLIVNGANCDKDYEWMKEKSEGFDVEVINRSSEYSLLAVQGPDAPKLVGELTDFDVESVPYYAFQENVEIAGVPTILSNSGYTGEKGYEIYIPWDKGPEVLRAILDKGAVPCGLGCRDTLRFEAGMPLYGNEMDEDSSPIEAGLKFAIKFDKGDFIGKKALEEYLEEGQKRKIVGIELKGKGSPRQGYKILKDGKEIGEITTGYISPTVGKAIANAIIDIDQAEIGNTVDVQIRKKTVPAEVISRKYLENK